MLHLRKVRSLAAAVLACALMDLLRGRDTAEILSWIQGRPAALPFWLACQWLELSPQATRERLQAMAAEPTPQRTRGPVRKRSSARLPPFEPIFQHHKVPADSPAILGVQDWFTI